MWKAINTWLRNFFGFSRTEANGFVLLLIIMLLFLFLPFINKQILLQNHPDIFLDSDYQQLDSLLVLMDEQLVEEQRDPSPFSPKNTEKVVLRNFDPNTANSATLQSLGFPQFLADRVVKYRNKVKPFANSADLLLIYGMDSIFYLTIKPYIKIEKTEKFNSNSKAALSDFEKDSADNHLKSYKTSPKKFILQPFNVNTADTTQLKKIYGIGSVYAQRIIDYRDLLGGFVSKEQYKEIYGLKSPNLDSLQKYAKMEEMVQVRQLKLNTCSEEELSRHPYISYKQAKLIISFRNAHGNYHSVEDLMKIKVIDSSFISRIKPYLLIEP